MKVPRLSVSGSWFAPEAYVEPANVIEFTVNRADALALP